MKRIRAGELGELTTSWAFFGNHFPDEWPLSHRIYNPEIGGGALLDMGVYAVSYISMLSGDAEPLEITSAGKLFKPTGVDGQVFITLSYPGELMSIAGTAIKSNMKAEGFVSGTKGRAVIPEYWNAESFTITSEGKTEEIKFPKDVGRFTYEAGAVMDDIRAGRTESEIIPHSATLTVMNILETARKNLGFYYPHEK
jgi:predicted dehydrogenase